MDSQGATDVQPESGPLHLHSKLKFTQPFPRDFFDFTWPHPMALHGRRQVKFECKPNDLALSLIRSKMSGCLPFLGGQPPVRLSLAYVSVSVAVVANVYARPAWRLGLLPFPMYLFRIFCKAIALQQKIQICKGISIP